MMHLLLRFDIVADAYRGKETTKPAVECPNSNSVIPSGANDPTNTADTQREAADMRRRDERS